MPLDAQTQDLAQLCETVIAVWLSRIPLRGGEAQWENSISIHGTLGSMPGTGGKQKHPGKTLGVETPGPYWLFLDSCRLLHPARAGWSLNGQDTKHLCFRWPRR